MKPAVFTDPQNEELRQPLSSQVVKQRRQGGTQLSYVEGWWVIRELNRIFGFDGWTQDVVELKCVSERERKIGRDQRDGWGVSYVARVRLTVLGIQREGVGAGHGIDADCGLAHESAIKEAATDALKRAAMTFGNPFGLALYDKDRADVDDAPPSTTPVSDMERLNTAFTAQLNQKLEAIGVNSVGIQTLKVILNVRSWDEVSVKLRGKLLDNLTADYAKVLNTGKNSRGQQVVEVVEQPQAPSIADLQAAAAEALNV